MSAIDLASGKSLDLCPRIEENALRMRNEDRRIDRPIFSIECCISGEALGSMFDVKLILTYSSGRRESQQGRQIK